LTIFYQPHAYSQQRQKEKKRWIYPVKLAMQAQHYRNLGHKVVWDHKGPIPLQPGDKIISDPEQINFIHLPIPDRVFTNAFDKRYQRNGNFKYHPGTYIQVADGCWYGKCSFCVERLNTWRVRPVWDVINELISIQRLGFKEVFDDSGTFPVGKWLDDFISGIRKHNVTLRLGCNMRLCDAPFVEMRSIGFRMVLFGVESANQKTLDRIHKGVRVEDQEHIISAAKAGLEPHIAVMFGYPWETDEDAKHTLNAVHYLLKNGYAKTCQASLYTPCGGNGKVEHRKYIDRIYDVALSPSFWINKIKNIKSKEDLGYFMRQIREGLFHG